jgi:alkanesulfonate monooxygenase SsuD/methylene tetrahydromethanopterin reductase-like flavin-dependent oxidoreductase (luciferase family)
MPFDTKLKFIVASGNDYSEWESVKREAEEADKRGFWGYLISDHYMTPGSAGSSTLDAWTALTYLAGMTKSIRLGTLVTPIPFRPPGLLAKVVSTLDLVSSGRSILGVGAGWSRPEFDGYGKWSSAKMRVDMTDEGVCLILRLWQDNKVNFKGRYYKAKGAVLEPKPVQKPHPPLLFGGEGPRMLRMAGKYADICHIPDWTKPSPWQAREKVLGEARRHRRERKLSFAGGSSRLLGPRYARAQHEKKVEEANEHGCEFFIVSFPEERKGSLEALRDFADNIIPSFAT